jgi:hypothetical protein
MAKPINVIMPGFQVLISSNHPFKKGHPPKKKTIVDRPKRIYMDPGKFHCTPSQC